MKCLTTSNFRQLCQEHGISAKTGYKWKECFINNGLAGLGFDLLQFAAARLVPGFDLIAGLTGLYAKIAAADLVVTGEGSLDGQSLVGKGLVGIARLARA